MAERNMTNIKIINGALDDSDERGGTIVLRGVIDFESLRHLLIDDYQREALPLASLKGLIEAVKCGSTLPDIEIGMRGSRCSSDKDDNYILRDYCYIIDGQQRRNACLAAMEQDPNLHIRLGALIHFKTEMDWERERFRILNNLRAKVSPNVLLKNAREKHPGIATIYGLTRNDKTFPLYEKVSWGQRILRSEVTTALMLTRVAIHLHSHHTTGKGRVDLSSVIRSVDNLMNVIGGQSLRENLKTFFEIIDQCWGIKLIQYRQMAPYLRGTFLVALSGVLSDHTDFWRGPANKKLFMDIDLRRKLKQFPLNDPAVLTLAGSGGAAHLMLYGLIRDHLNKGRRIGMLTPRKVISPATDDNTEEEEAA